MHVNDVRVFFFKHSTLQSEAVDACRYVCCLLPLYFLYLGVLLVVVLLGADPAAHQVVPDSVSQGEVVVPGRGDIPVLDQGEVEVTVKVPLDSGNVFEPRNAAHANLFPLLLVAERRRRHVFGILARTTSTERGLSSEDEPGGESGLPARYSTKTSRDHAHFEKFQTRECRGRGHQRS